MKPSDKITASSTAEYFSKNLQQVGFSSHIKAVLTVLKESVDNAIDACEEAGILPEVYVSVEKVGEGSLKNSDQIKIIVIDNGPGIDPDDVPKVFGEYLASSKFGRGRCSRGQQGIGISAAVTWAQLTNAMGVRVITKQKSMKKAMTCIAEVDIKSNKGVLKDKSNIDWAREHGTSVEFLIDGRIQTNGEIGILTYLTGTALVNPHLTLKYKLGDAAVQTMDRVTNVMPEIPEAADPHPHTMKLGEFISHSHYFGNIRTSAWLKKGFSRINEGVITALGKQGCTKILNKNVTDLDEVEIKELFKQVQDVKLMAPLTKSVMSIGEEAFSKSINRLGSIDFFAVLSRRPAVCDFKPVLVEVAMARLKGLNDNESPVQVLRFANRVPLQFDKSSCAIVKAIESVYWKSYGLAQPKGSLPLGPYIVAVSVVSPFIKFKNASKETIDASDELVEEIRKALIQAGQRLSKHIKHEAKAGELEEKMRHIELFCPVLIEGLCSITKANASRKKAATAGLAKLLGRDALSTQKELDVAEDNLDKAKEKGTLQMKSNKKDSLDDILDDL